jgi:membrane-bound serine protease (ClpP class)
MFPYIMNTIKFLSTFFFLTLLALIPITARSQVVVIDIKGEVDLGMASYVERSIADAETKNAIIVLHVSTFGGRVDAAVQIRDQLLNAKVPITIAFIDKRAISAGALISLSAKKIVMSPGSSFGAATPVDGSGTKASEKVVSYMRAEMRSTAEHHGRDPLIAQAMVDESILVDSSQGIILETGKLLTLTNEDAKRVGYIDAEANTIEEALTKLGLPIVNLERAEENFGDRLIRFLTLPLISSILIMIGLGGIFYTIKTGHFGSITIASVIALAIFFGGQYITDVAPTLAAVLFIVGIVLLVAELFIPAFGVIGIIGVLCIFGGLFLSLAGDLRFLTPDRLRDTLVSLAISLVGFVAIAALIFRYAPGWPMVRKLVNQTFSGDMTAVIEKQNLLLGKIGTAVTSLRPAGSAIFEGEKIDVVTQGEFINSGASVTIINVTGNRAVVKQS